MALALTDQEFAWVRAWLYRVAGIHLSGEKRALVASRLSQRLESLCCGMANYLHLIQGSVAEAQVALDLLTTHETQFFREPAHFQQLAQWLQNTSPTQSFRVWSAACSTGEEAYSIAMVLADYLGGADWSVLASDVSQRVLQQVQSGIYLAERAVMPAYYRQTYCLKGTGGSAGRLQVDGALRRRVKTQQINLAEPLPALPQFDVIFLRNVMIYFDLKVRNQVIRRIVEQLPPGGYLCLGHAESLQGIHAPELSLVQPATYRKVCHAADV